MPRASAEERLTRLLAIIPWVVERGGSTIAEIADRFDLPEGEVLSELSLVQCCEIPPYGPDNTLGIAVVDDEILVEPSAMLHRPLRLGPREGFGLLAAGRAASSVPGADPSGALASALDKLEAALGDRAPVVIDIDRPEALDELRGHVDQKRQIAMNYYAAYRDAVTTRVVDPLALINRDGNWYLRGHCHTADAERTFRVDRIEHIEPTGQNHDRALVDGAGRYAPGEDGQEVVLSLPHTARWVTETYPTVHVEEKARDLRVTMVVAGTVFLERLLLRVGPKARVISPPELVDVGARAASRLLDRYTAAS
jgi:proteasome accessory factor C